MRMHLSKEQYERYHKILKAVLMKAIDNGWDKHWHYNSYCTEVSVRKKMYYMVIFSHSFAKAFWGEAECPWDIESKKCKHCGYDIGIQPRKETGCDHVHYPENCDICSAKAMGWEEHLQKMIVCEEPLLYLEKFL
jgi:hypothetical protein